MERRESHRRYVTGDPAADGVLAARCGVALVLATGALSATIVAYADSGNSRVLALSAIAALALLTVAAEARARDRRPDRVAPLAALAALATVVIAQSTSDTDGRTAVVLYPTVIVYAVYFCHPAVAAALVATVAISRFLLISAPGADVTALSSFVTVSTLILTAGVVWVLRERLRALLARLDDAARTDPLTGLLNRRGTEERLEAEISDAQRRDSSVVVLFGDLDDFKPLNDRLGHLAGDEALQRVARVLEGKIRAHDVVGRQGGDEFLVVAPDLDPERADAYAQRLQAAVATAFEDEPVALTLTIGTATYPEDAQTAERVIDAADQRLYARKTGRGAPEAGRLHLP